MTALELTLLYLLAAVLGVATCRWLKLPAILGYLVAGVPVEASVAAILRPTWPLLPMPMTTTRPVT